MDRYPLKILGDLPKLVSPGHAPSTVDVCLTDEVFSVVFLFVIVQNIFDQFVQTVFTLFRSNSLHAPSFKLSSLSFVQTVFTLLRSNSLHSPSFKQSSLSFVQTVFTHLRSNSLHAPSFKQSPRSFVQTVFTLLR